VTDIIKMKKMALGFEVIVARTASKLKKNVWYQHEGVSECLGLQRHGNLKKKKR